MLHGTRNFVGRNPEDLRRGPVFRDLPHSSLIDGACPAGERPQRGLKLRRDFRGNVALDL
jgi:hypothetical protein